MCFPPSLPGNKISQKQIGVTNVTLPLKTVWLNKKFKHHKKKKKKGFQIVKKA